MLYQQSFFHISKIIRTKFINKNYNNFLGKYFGINKIQKVIL